MKLKFIIKKSYSILKEYRFQLAFSLFLSLLSAISGGLSIGLLLPIIDNNPEYVIEQLGLNFLNDLFDRVNISNELEQVRFFALLIILMTVIETILGIFSSFISINISAEVIVKLQNRLVNKFYSLNQKYRNNIDNGYIFSLISENSRQIGNLFSQVMASTKNIFKVVIYGYVLIKVSLIMTISAFLFLVVFSVLIKAFFGNKLKKQSELTLKSIEELNGSLIENLRNSKFIKGSGRKGEFQSRLEVLINNYKINFVKRNKIGAVSSPIFNTLNAVSIAILLILGTYFIDLPLDEWLPLMVPFIIIIFRLVGPINSLNSIRVKIEGVIPDLLRVLNFLESSQEKEQEEGEDEFIKFNKEINFENIHFQYSEDREFNLENLNLIIPKNNTIALVGPSGGGKSTIIELLMRIYDYEKGNLLVDGVDLKNYNNSSWQKKIAYVSQDPIIFNASVRDNLMWFNPDATEKEMIDATKNAQIYEFISDLDNSFDFIFRDNGSGLSGGQKQRIAIARALLVKSEILVFDEATSQIDIESESEIYQILDKLKQTLTIVIVAHRLNAIKNVDNIYIVNHGKIIEKGPHEELIKFSNFYSDSLNKLNKKNHPNKK
tara:strand:+ start:1643 stop:3457 length:1815 start_codon:yes stop_codon:yes gene_type:complete